MPDIKLVVEVISASNFSPKDGEGSASPYAEVQFDSQKLRTKTKNKDLSPVWNEKLEFTVSDAEVLEEECLEVSLYSARKHGRGVLIGRACIDPSHIKIKGQEKAISYPLERGFSIFTFKRGEIFLKVYFYDERKQVKPPGGGGGASGSTPAGGDKGGDAGKKKGGNGGGAAVAVADKLLGVEKGPQSVTWAGDTSSADFSVKPTYLPKTEHIQHNLVDKIKYLFVRVERARDLAAKDVTGSSDPFVEAKVGNVKVATIYIPRDLNPVWNEVFAFSQDQFQSQNVEITVWDKDNVSLRNDFLGHVNFDITEVPERHPPDSPLAPQWYRLESRHDVKKLVQGEIMLSVWIGTQADEAFPRARQSDSGWVAHTRATVYLSPRLWYLRVIVLEAQDLVVTMPTRVPEVMVRVELGLQKQRTKTTSSRPNNPVWKDELLFVAAEPFSDESLHVHVLDHVATNKDEPMGFVKIPLNTVPRRANHLPVNPKWYELERQNKELKEVAHEVAEKIKGQAKFMSRIHLLICLEGGYHVLDESTQYTSDTCPSDRKLWKSPVAVLELGIRGAVGLQPMKARDNKSCTDAYCVAKYGQKWVRTRTVLDSLNPRWHEQYMWDVYDPCTVLTVGVFDNNHLASGGSHSDKGHAHGPGGKGNLTHGGHGSRDEIIGKVRIRLSTLETDREYAHRYPLIVLDRSGVKSRGEVELVVRLSCKKRLNMMLAYIYPLLPKQHYVHPMNVRHTEQLREAAIGIVTARLARSEPPVRAEVVRYMLDIDQYRWSYRRSKANFNRIRNVFDGLVAVAVWFRDICRWRNPITTVLVHVLYFILVWYPELILPTLFLYMFLIGAWQYRFRARQPPHMDVSLSHANATGQEELDEEFDSIPSAKSPEVVRMRYDRMRSLAGRVQTVMGDLATQLERFHSFLNWRDPRATTIFITFCLITAIILYVTPIRVLAILIGFYILRHPRFRTHMPSYPMNFFRRLPALSDRML